MKIIQDVAGLLQFTKDKKIIFMDFDGVFADTEPSYWKSVATILESVGVTELTPNLIARHSGSLRPILRELGVCIEYYSESLKELVDYNYFRCYAEGITPYSFVKPFLEDKGADVWIVTANTTSVVRSQLLYWGLDSLIDRVYSTVDLDITKLTIMQDILGDKHCLETDAVMLEDNQTMLESLKSTDILGVGVPNNYKELDVEYILDTTML